MNKETVAVIVAAYNEEQRIGQVLDAITRAKLVDEVIVVSDGSTDRTVAVAKRYGNVRVIALQQNQGKGGAMCEGVAATSAQIVAFVDADLKGLRAEHVDAIIRPIIARQCQMCLGVFRGGKFWSDAAQRIAPYISGQRALRRELFLAIPHLRDVRMGVEITMHAFAKQSRMSVLRVVLHGVSNVHKEKKLGLMKGAKARAQMWREIATAVLRERRRVHHQRRLGKMRRTARSWREWSRPK